MSKNQDKLIALQTAGVDGLDSLGTQMVPGRKPPAVVAFIVDTGLQHYTVDLLAGNPITFCNLYFGAIEDIESASNHDLAGYGCGVRKHGDIYDREMGFRMALKSALVWIAREDRPAFWKAYLGLFPVESRGNPSRPEKAEKLSGPKTEIHIQDMHIIVNNL